MSYKKYWLLLCLAACMSPAYADVLVILPESGRFVKGDPRINRKGRPKTFDAFRELAQQISHEPAISDGQKLEINGHVVTVAEAILRRWAASKVHACGNINACYIQLTFFILFWL